MFLSDRSKYNMITFAGSPQWVDPPKSPGNGIRFSDVAAIALDRLLGIFVDAAIYNGVSTRVDMSFKRCARGYFLCCRSRGFSHRLLQLTLHFPSKGTCTYRWEILSVGVCTHELFSHGFWCVFCAEIRCCPASHACESSFHNPRSPFLHALGNPSWHVTYFG